MSATHDARIWRLALVANSLAVAFIAVGWATGRVSTEVVVGLATIFVMFETFIAVLWYTMVTRRMQVGLAQQTGLLANGLWSSLYEGMRNACMQINQLFVSKPYLRPYFYDGKPFSRDEADKENTLLYSELAAVADCLLDIFEGVVRNLGQFPDKVPEYDDGWRAYIRDVFANSPFLKAHLARHPDWYTSELQRIAGIDRSSAPRSDSSSVGCH